MAPKRARAQTTNSVTEPGAEEQAFLAAVLAEPDDNALRLVFADWLEEHGQPDRAEFIRLQIERVRAPWPQDAARQQREAALYQANHTRWLRGIPEGLHRVGFRRGFPGALYLSWFPRLLLDLDEGVWQAAPITELILGDFWLSQYAPDAPVDRPTLLRLMAATPALAHIRGLQLGESGATAADLEILLASPHLSRLHTLILSDNGLRGEIERLPACLARLPALKFLALEGNQVGEREVGILLASGLIGRLTTLVLGANNLGDAGTARLASSPEVRRLEDLSLHGNDITDRGAQSLAASPHLDGLQWLWLMANSIGPQGQAVLRERFGSRVVLE